MIVRLKMSVRISNLIHLSGNHLDHHVQQPPYATQTDLVAVKVVTRADIKKDSPDWITRHEQPQPTKHSNGIHLQI